VDRAVCGRRSGGNDAALDGHGRTLENVTAVLADRSESNYPLWVLVKGRCGFGGVLDNSGLKKKDLAEKWCPHVTGPALRRVFELRGRITLIEGDGIRALREYSDDRDSVGFADPPYSAEADGGPGRHVQGASPGSRRAV
jgi:hypothetical protein